LSFDEVVVCLLDLGGDEERRDLLMAHRAPLVEVEVGKSCAFFVCVSN